MKKTILIALLAIVAVSAKAQKLTEYKASNGVTYHLKDTVRLGRGSAPNGNFLYLMMGGWMASMEGIGKGYANAAVVIKSIKTGKVKGVERTYFVVGGGNITNYNLMIEEAIDVCEVTPCKSQSTAVVAAPASDKFDQLKKLKALLDDGTLTKEEYDEQKKKILNQ